MRYRERAARLLRGRVPRAKQALERLLATAMDVMPGAGSVLSAVGVDAWRPWLLQHRLARMDASSSLFDGLRREFHLARYRFASRYVEGSAVADVASGTGYGTEMLCREGKACSVLGVDLDRAAVAYSRRHHAGPGVRYVCAGADSTGLPDASVDVVTSFETLEHVPSDGDTLDEFARILRPGGLLVISTPNDWPVEGHPFHVRTYDRPSFVAVLAGRFAGIELHNQNSGSPTAMNRGQPAGIVPTLPHNDHLAECFIAICRRA